jgi:hypothetical protein
MLRVVMLNVFMQSVNMLNVTYKPFMLRVVMLNVFMQSVIMLNVTYKSITLGVVMMSVVMMSVVMLNAVMLSVVASNPMLYYLKSSNDIINKHAIGLYHPIDGVTSLKYKLLCSITTNFFQKERKALAFNRDRCCHLALCLWLILFHCNFCYARKLRPQIVTLAIDFLFRS